MLFGGAQQQENGREAKRRLDLVLFWGLGASVSLLLLLLLLLRLLLRGLSVEQANSSLITGGGEQDQPWPLDS